MLRSGPELDPLRAFLADHDLNPQEILMVGFIEDADGVVPGKDGFVLGVLVEAGDKVYE